MGHVIFASDALLRGGFGQFKTNAASVHSALEADSGSTSGAEYRKIREEADAENRAREKLKEAKEQLAFLQRGGFPPEVIKRLALDLTASLRGVLDELSQSLGMASSSIGIVVPVISTVTNVTNASNSTVHSGQDQSRSLVQQAYDSVMDDFTTHRADQEVEDLRDQLSEVLRQARSLASSK